MHCLILKLAVLGILSVQASPIELNHHMQGSTTLVDKNNADLQLSRSKNCNLNDFTGHLVRAASCLQQWYVSRALARRTCTHAFRRRPKLGRISPANLVLLTAPSQRHHNHRPTKPIEYITGIPARSNPFLPQRAPNEIHCPCSTSPQDRHLWHRLPHSLVVVEEQAQAGPLGDSASLLAAGAAPAGLLRYPLLGPAPESR